MNKLKKFKLFSRARWLKKVLLFLIIICFTWIFNIKSLFIFPNSVTLPSYLSKIGVSVFPEQSLEKENSKVCVFIINLDQDVNRYRSIVPLVTQLNFPYQRVSGILGSTLSKAFFNNFVDKKIYKLAFNGANPGAGEVGCFLSHVKVWTLFLNSNAQFALILEDDAKFNPIFLGPMIRELIKNKNSWDICSLFLPTTPLKTVLISDLLFSHKLVRFLTETTGAVGLLLNRKAAKALLSKAEKYTLPVDHYIQRTWEFDTPLQFTGVVPGLISEMGHPSSIEQQGRRQCALKILGEGALQRMRSQIFHGKSRLIYFLYNGYLTLSQFFSTPTQKTEKNNG
ncbi:glycosyltransferase family 25 protein [Holospora curviuscula]|uniref:Glycosyltransferase family 25 (LPS biosynthesis protein) n=1 Tax=Holospora curviuscula TaxID=1082868 RepID=A0A2S5R892_9PROT|nr:glycosyltransferase family 25 protein [Holospora curviuscula]PPE03520.1 Glycosyltransferase family 25 (LPS biosynthesis protein) [Holospora curviuscula]